MARCEDFPCCGHELGCCPDYDEETGKQLNMKCTCGATVPIDNGSSLCDGCLYGNKCFDEDGEFIGNYFDRDESDFYDPDHYDNY